MSSTQDHEHSLVLAKTSRYWDHILHFTPDPYGGSWRLECAPHGEHFTADTEEWDCSADELEANGVTVDRSTCWVHHWLDNACDTDEWMSGGPWPEDGPWHVVCSYSGSLDVEPIEVGS